MDSNEDKPDLIECAGDVELGIRAFAQYVGSGPVEFDLPFDEPWNRAIESVVESVETRPEPWSMARNLAGGLSEAEVRRIFAAPGAHHWQLDNF